MLESFPPEKRLIEESPEGVRLLSHYRTLFVSVPYGGGVQTGCKVGVLWPPFKSTHLIRGMGAIASTLLGGGGGLPVCLNTKNKRLENSASLQSYTFVSFQQITFKLGFCTILTRSFWDLLAVLTNICFLVPFKI